MRNKPELRVPAKARELKVAKADLKKFTDSHRVVMGHMRHALDTKIREQEVQRSFLNHPAGKMVLEHCRDKIVEDLMYEIMKTAKLVAIQIPHTGEYEVCISMPERNIYHRYGLKQMELVRDVDMDKEIPIKRIDVRMFETRKE